MVHGLLYGIWFIVWYMVYSTWYPKMRILQMIISGRLSPFVPSNEDVGCLRLCELGLESTILV